MKGATVRAWIRAARPLAQGNLAPGLLFGQALAWHMARTFEGLVLAAVMAFGVLDQLVIMFANDVADAEADRFNAEPTPFSGGSRVLQEGTLSRESLKSAAIVSAVGLLALSIGIAALRGRPGLVVAAVLALLLLHAYSFAPLRLSYRGGGEWLQAIGVGAVLPYVGFAAQAPASLPMPWRFVAVPVLLGFAGNLATSLPDREADGAAVKRTFAVQHGAATTARTVAAVTLAAAALLVADLASRPWAAAAIAGPPALAMALSLAGAAPGSGRRAVPFVVRFGAASTWLLLGWSLALVITPPGSSSH